MSTSLIAGSGQEVSGKLKQNKESDFHSAKLNHDQPQNEINLDNPECIEAHEAEIDPLSSLFDEGISPQTSHNTASSGN